MEERAEVNCIGFGYHHLGIIEKEVAIEPPTYRQLRKDFYRVYDVGSADVIALVAPDTDRLVMVKHIIVIEAGKQRVAHRPGPNKEIQKGFLEDEMQKYDKYADLEPVLLARKVK